MSLRLYNTLSAKVEDFVPLDPGRVTMYVCGPTVYNYIHIGNARPVVVFDALFRLLRHDYPGAVYARNITDIDDKIITAAAESGRSCGEIARDFTAAFHTDIAELNTLAPSVEPRATGHIEEIIAMTQALLDKGAAYEAENHVLFDVPAFKRFGVLSKRKREELIDGARVDVAPYKKDPADFVLWKPSDDDQPGWDSPWGRGRPGWHMECSVMSAKHLGREFDIHGGGQDLVFPHHENEIAQSYCAHDDTIPARYWVHNGHILLEGRKMAKSTGNFLLLRDILKKFPGETVRYALLKTHYQKPLDWSLDALHEAHANVNRLYRAAALKSGPAGEAEPHDEVLDALRDNLNTVEALRVIQGLAKAKKGDVLYASCGLLGLLESEPDAWFKRAGDESREQLSNDEIDEYIERRRRLRESGDYAGADKVRTQLEEAGLIIEDSAEGTTWQRKV